MSDICEREKEREKEFEYGFQFSYVGIEFYDGKKYRVHDGGRDMLHLINIANKVISLRDAKILKNRYGARYHDFKLASEVYDWPLISDTERKAYSKI